MTLSDHFRRRPARFGTLVVCAGGLLASCSSETTKPRGQLMLAITTDLSITKDMNQVGVDVFGSTGKLLSSLPFDLLPVEGGLPIPGTLAVVPPDSGGQSVRVRVSAKTLKGDVETTSIVREAFVTVPTDRVALLRMPLHWLCEPLTQPDPGGGFTSGCDEGQTCIGGVCQSADVDVNDLPTYAPAQVFGGGTPTGEGSYCLDVQTCFDEPEIATPSADCTVPLPDGADPAKLNVALVLPAMSEGHCLGDMMSGSCYIPLDSDPVDGYAISGGQIKLPPAACLRPDVSGVAVSTQCRTKDLTVPICGPWTGWKAPPGSGEAGQSGGGMGGAPEGGAAGAPQGGTNAVSGGTGGVSGAAGSPEGGNGETGGSSPGPQPCPATAPAARAYYYVLLDTTSEMQTLLAPIRQALSQFANEAASSGVYFGLQLAQAACQGDYSQPVVDFTPLPTQVPNNLQAGNQPSLQLDDAMVQTLQTLQYVPDPASRTLVVITGGFDQLCGTLTDVMQQALSDALSSGISVRPVLVLGNDTPNLTQGLQTNGSPQLVQFNGQNLNPASLVASLDTFRDTLGPCTFVAPKTSPYDVNLTGTSQTTSLTEVSSASACAQSLSYYSNGATFTLCPAACTSKGTDEVQTETCAVGTSSGGTGGAGGTSGGAGGTSGGARGMGTAGTFGRGGRGAGGAGTAPPACCTATKQAGCAADAPTELCVCQAQQSCCQTTWDTTCVALAQAQCNLVCQ